MAAVFKAEVMAILGFSKNIFSRNQQIYENRIFSNSPASLKTLIDSVRLVKVRKENAKQDLTM